MGVPLQSSPLLGPIRGGWLVALGVASGVAMFGAQTLLPVGDATRRPDLLGGPTIAGVTGVLLLWPLAKRGAGLRASLALAWALLPQFTLALLLALCALTTTIARSHGEGYADAAALCMARLFAFVVAVAVAKELPAAVKASNALRGPTARTSVASLLALGLVCIVAGVRTHRRPPVEGYVQRLPVLGAIPAIESLPVDGERVFVHAVGPLRVRRQYTDQYTAGTSLVLERESPIPIARRTTWRAGKGAAIVRYDARIDAVIFEGPLQYYAFRRSTGEAINITVRELAPWHAPPRAWIASALVGLVLALAILAWPRRVPESLLRWRSARQGSLSHDDVVTFADNTPFVKLSPGHGLAPGFVLMLYERPAEPHRESLRVQPFRDAVGSPPDAIAQGTQRAVLDAIECVESGPRVLAVTVAVVSSTPLLVATALGYVL